MQQMPTLPEDPFVLFVNGTLMRGLALHANLDGAEFLGEAATVPIYRLYSIGDVHPGMFEVAVGGVSVSGELYRVPPEVWRRVEAGEPPDLYLGPVLTVAHGEVQGILYPRALAEGRHRDISAYSGWREYLRGGFLVTRRRADRRADRGRPRCQRGQQRPRR
jgi:gamma-glutamylcyclotransferase (GGCT)/AIG2-like uncharacterized protein YtfP